MMRAVLAVVIFVALIFAVAALPAYLLTLVWNNFLATFVQVPHLPFWVAFAIIALCRYMFGAVTSSSSSGAKS